MSLGSKNFGTIFSSAYLFDLVLENILFIKLIGKEAIQIKF